MKQRLADYVADFLVERGITDCFTVVGGGAMHLNDAFGHKEGLRCTYQHHEQACAMAADGYARVENRPALVCVTTGPGGTNALTGVAGAYLDSVPMFVVSGQVRYDTTARYMEQFTDGYPLRALGDQELDITKAAACMTKYAVMTEDPTEIRYQLERAWHLMMSGRKGPVWIDIPVNFQGMTIETEELAGYDPAQEAAAVQGGNGLQEQAGTRGGNGAQEQAAETRSTEPQPVSESVVRAVLLQLRMAKRPVFYAGNGIRLSGGCGAFAETVRLLGIPVVTGWDSIDLIESGNPYYTGRGGNMGDRPGNFAVQNADLILAVGNRLSIRQVGYNFKEWAPRARVIMVDIDPAELRKTTVHVDLPVCADAKEFLEKLNDCARECAESGSAQSAVRSAAKRTVAYSPAEQSAVRKSAENPAEQEVVQSPAGVVWRGDAWQEACRRWKERYPVTLPRHWEENGRTANVYAFIDYLSRRLPDGSLTVVSNGSACVVGSQNYKIGKGSRFLVNSAIASMGYGLPAAIGACIAAGRKETVCIEGDGSVMMNLQELQTVLTNRLPLRIFLINNAGYHSIRQTQNNLFHGHSKVGIGPESEDLSFPEFEKVARAFGYRYLSAHSNAQMKEAVDEALASDGAVFCEIFCDTVQNFEPKSATKRLPDGSLVSPPLEDLAPFLPPEEVRENMEISSR
ncbi:MAG: thiamine pyrophosphate-binding protein [Eubacteriales bacterium]|nr:thiamine pyrophosphate-binding protein [Eubacteriales bacterium]